jgi:hypothetical protein
VITGKSLPPAGVEASRAWGRREYAADPALDLVSVWHLLDATQRNVVRARLNPGEVQWRRGMAWAFEHLLHREPFQMVTAIQQPGHCLWRVRKPLSPQAPDE